MKKSLKITLFVVAITLVTISTMFFVWREGGGLLEPDSNGSLPFGSGSGVGSNDTRENEAPLEDGLFFDENGVLISNLFRISNTPVAGVVALSRAGQSVVRYVERATGHIVEVILPLEGVSSSLEIRKITNTTMPQIYEAYFRPDGNAALFRSLRKDNDSQVNTLVILTPPTGTSTDLLYRISTTPVRGEIGDMAVVGNSLYYSLKDPRTIVSSSFEGSPVRTHFNSALTNWRLTPAGNNIIIHPKASHTAPGIGYTLNTTNGSLTKIVGPLNALALTPNKTGTRVYYSYNEGGVIGKTRNLQSGAESTFFPAPLAEKCTWSEKRVSVIICGIPTTGTSPFEPDLWYRGETNWSDNIWEFDTNTDVAKVLSEPTKILATNVDLVKPQLSPLEDYLIFINKRDMTLWALKLQ